MCKKSIISASPAGTPFPVYCSVCWWGDGWDGLQFGADYDFSVPFFEQFKRVLLKVPRMNLFQRGSSDSPHSNMLAESKRVYLSISVVESEDISYSWAVDKSFHIFDSYSVSNSEQCFENRYCDKNYASHFLHLSRNCIDSWFLFDCVNCKNCALSSNLRNKEYVMRNKQCSKEEYSRQLEMLKLGSFRELEELKEEFGRIELQAIHKYANVTKSVNATGDNILNSKNLRECFDVHDLEDVTRSFRTLNLKDAMDIEYGGLSSELVYEYVTGGKTGYNIKWSIAALESDNDLSYTDYCASSSNLFGCAGIRGKSYCILNKQYTKEEYEAMMPKIKKHMDDVPYADKKGRVYRYGEFFPSEISPYAYNETIAQEHFPMTKEKALERGFTWRDPDTKEYAITKRSGDLPDHIKDAPDSILQETIGCRHEGKCMDQCTTAFRLTPEEFQFYKKMGIPLPRLCPNCRHYEHIRLRNPMRLWHRQCMCDKATHQHRGHCPNEFETSYSPERKEIVYCEQCYQSEVV
jgi:hypothetical protein